MDKSLRTLTGYLLLVGLQGGAVLSIVIHPFMLFLLTSALLITSLLLYYNQVLLVILANVGLIKGALITGFPIFESFDITVALSILTLVVLAWKLTDPDTRRSVVRHQYIFLAFLMWVFWMITSSLNAPLLDQAFEKSLRFALFNTILFISPVIMIRSRKDSRTLLNLFLGFAVLGAIILLGQLAFWLKSGVSFQQVVRLTILSANPIAAGRVLSIGAAMSAMMIISRKGNVWYWSGLMVLFLLTALFTGSRGPILSFVAGTFLIGVLLNRESRKRTIFYGVAIAVVLSLAIMFAPEELTSRYRFYQEGELAAMRQTVVVLNTISFRIYLWEKALALWTKDILHLLMGGGTASFVTIIPWRDVKYPHNLPLEVLAEFGLIGLGVFSLHVLGSVKRIYAGLRSRIHREEILWLVGGATMFLATMFSGDLNDNRLLWFFLGGLLATATLDTNPHTVDRPLIDLSDAGR